jgi:hypothetical protein
MHRSVLTTNEQVGDSVVLVFTGNDEALVSEWVKRVRDRDFARQNSGIMNCLPIAADNEQQRSTASSLLAN